MRNTLKMQSFRGLGPWTPTGALPLYPTGPLIGPLDPTLITIEPPNLKNVPAPFVVGCIYFPKFYK